MRSESKETPVTEERTINAGGKTVVQKVSSMRPSIVRTISFRDPRYIRLIRTRTLKPMPDIDVTGAADPWTMFEEAYKTANTP